MFIAAQAGDHSVSTAGRTDFRNRRRNTAKRLFAEIGAIFKAAGIPKDPGLEEESYRTLTSMSYHMKSSMLRDMEKGRVTEGDHLHGFCLRKRKACQLIHLFWKPSAPTCKCMKRNKKDTDRLLFIKMPSFRF